VGYSHFKEQIIMRIEKEKKKKKERKERGV
jgi:hypothetical protein